MDRKTFWRSAFNWGCTGGAVLFVVALAEWGIGLSGGVGTLLTAIILGVLIFVTGRRNAAMSSPQQGYPYGRAIGFVLAMMLFVGLVYGIGQYFLMNVIAPEYYDSQLAAYMSHMPAAYQEMLPTMLSMMKSPMLLIFSGIFAMEFWGLFVGLIVCAFVTRRPDIFASQE